MIGKLKAILESGTPPNRRPVLRKHNESNVRNMYIIGDLAGAPVIKLAMQQGYDVIDHIASLPDAKGGMDGVLDVLIVGAGGSGLNAALEAKERGLSCVALEKSRVANTIENFPEKKWVYAEPDSVPAKGKLWLDGATKEDLVARWRQIVEENRLDVRTEEGVESIDKDGDGFFHIRTGKGEYRAQRVILAVGQRGNPRKLGVPGEEREKVYHRLYSPRHYKGEKILVVGGGNSAIEAALVLSEQNEVTLSYRKEKFFRLFKDNQRKLDAAKNIEVVFNSNVTGFKEETYALNGEDRPYDHAFVLVGAEMPVKFLRSVGIRMENEWRGSFWAATGLTAATLLGLSLAGPDERMASLASGVPGWIPLVAALGCLAGLFTLGFRGSRFAWLGVSFLVCYTIYGAKVGNGSEFWPYKGWGYSLFSFFGFPLSSWYTVLYTALMTVFGIQAIKRWGFDRRDKFQIWRYISLLTFQWTFFFIIPMFLFSWAIEYRWVGEALANDPKFVGEQWRAYGIVYAWPLFFYTFLHDPHWIWVIWGVFLTFVLIPLLAIFQGKRYCSWICGCGGLAETLGDRWRHLAPKGRESVRWEWMNMAVIVLALAVTAGMLIKDLFGLLVGAAPLGLSIYAVFVDVWLVGILPVTLYPFLGGKVWCRYWCPLAKLMAFVSSWAGKFKIKANDKCIGCNECTRNCQVGIDVMGYALKQETLDNKTSSCIGCGICVTVCPMDCLTFGDPIRSHGFGDPKGAESAP